MSRMMSSHGKMWNWRLALVVGAYIVGGAAGANVWLTCGSPEIAALGSHAKVTAHLFGDNMTQRSYRTISFFKIGQKSDSQQMCLGETFAELEKDCKKRGMSLTPIIREGQCSVELTMAVPNLTNHFNVTYKVTYSVHFANRAESCYVQLTGPGAPSSSSERNPHPSGHVAELKTTEGHIPEKMSDGTGVLIGSGVVVVVVVVIIAVMLIRCHRLNILRTFFGCSSASRPDPEQYSLNDSTQSNNPTPQMPSDQENGKMVVND